MLNNHKQLSKEEREEISLRIAARDGFYDLRCALATIDELERGLSNVTEQFQLRAIKLAEAESRQKKLVEALKPFADQINSVDAGGPGFAFRVGGARADWNRLREALREIGEAMEATSPPAEPYPQSSK